MAVWAHEHNYERFWPLFNSTVRNGTSDPDNPYHNPRATVHFTTGTAVSSNIIMPCIRIYYTLR